MERMLIKEARNVICRYIRGWNRTDEIRLRVEIFIEISRLVSLTRVFQRVVSNIGG